MLPQNFEAISLSM